jgi:CheY-like chemotaxis protein
MLTAILGYAYFLADEFPPDDPRRKDVEEIVRAGERSAALTRQLLAFSRKQILQPAVLNLNVLVGDTTEMLRRVIGEHIQIDTSLDDDVHPVCADPTQLEQIVMNLAVNARDAMPGGGRLTITTRNTSVNEEANNDNDTGPVMPGSYVELAVSDDGYGMDDDTKRRLFEPFFTTKDQGQGTGLGLATVYGIVKQSGGHISVESEPLQGSTFKVYLPAVLDVSAIAIRPTGTFPAARGTETILLVEDERAVRTLTRAILERGGYTVLDAGSPEEALDLFLEHRDKIQLLISDVVMPGSSGPGLYERLVILHPSLRVLFMSGYTEDDGVRDSRSGAGIEFIEKPFTAIRLMQKVRDVLDRRV